MNKIFREIELSIAARSSLFVGDHIVNKYSKELTDIYRYCISKVEELSDTEELVDFFS